MRKQAHKQADTTPLNQSCSRYHSQVPTAPQWQSASPARQFQVAAISDHQKLSPAHAAISETQAAAAFTCSVTDSKAPIRETKVYCISS